MSTIREKKHRLPRQCYGGFVCAAFTANIFNRRTPFLSTEVVRRFETILLEELTKYHCSTYAYVFMPDHVHIIIAGESETSSILDCVNMFKQRTGYWFYKNLREIRWQKDYYDHIIRSERDLSNQVRYILLNPVRAGLVKTWTSYPFKGSTKYDLSSFPTEL